MWIILLEALAALLLLVGLVWWTMFSGRPRGERPGQDGATASSEPVAQVPLAAEPPKPPASPDSPKPLNPPKP